MAFYDENDFLLLLSISYEILSEHWLYSITVHIFTFLILWEIKEVKEF